MKPISAHREHVFPSRNNPRQSMNSQTANAALKRIGYGGKLVAHGLRSIASTAMNEAGFNADVIEAALAHSDKNEVRKAYNRSTYLQQRIELMTGGVMKFTHDRNSQPVYSRLANYHSIFFKSESGKYTSSNTPIFLTQLSAKAVVNDNSDKLQK